MQQKSDGVRCVAGLKLWLVFPGEFTHVSALSCEDPVARRSERRKNENSQRAEARAT